ncbi:MAG: DUF4251 domain-containing protein [Chryseolinea sp.]
MKLILAILLMFVGLELHAQKDIVQSVKDKRFTINVESMSPRRGGYKRLSSLYTFKVTPDTVVTDLPYAGRAYQAPMGTDDTGIKFLSREFEYTAKPGKKGAWEIQLKLKDTRNYPVISLTLQPGGSASIRISPVDKDFISYTGTVIEK